VRQAAVPHHEQLAGLVLEGAQRLAAVGQLRGGGRRGSSRGRGRRDAAITAPHFTCRQYAGVCGAARAGSDAIAKQKKGDGGAGAARSAAAPVVTDAPSDHQPE
jgi:hypothetical protein